MRVDKNRASKRLMARQKLSYAAGISCHAALALFGVGATGVGLQTLAGNTGAASNTLSLILLGLGFLLILGSNRAIRDRRLQLRAIRSYSPA